MILGADNITAIGGLIVAVFAGVTATASVIRNRNTDSRDDLETIIESFKGLLEAERETTDRQVRSLTTQLTEVNSRLIDMQLLHEECERDRRDLMARMGLG